MKNTLRQWLLRGGGLLLPFPDPAEGVYQTQHGGHRAHVF